MELNAAVKLYAKLPGRFTTATPLGGYNPDWAVVVDVAGEEKLFVVVETKGSLFEDALRDAEDAETRCSGEHFSAMAALGSGATFVRAISVGDFEKHW